MSNILEKIGNFFQVRFVIKNNFIYLNSVLNKPIGKIQYGTNDNYLIFEIFNIDLLLSNENQIKKNSNLIKQKEDFEKATYIERDYSCIMRKDQFNEIYYEQLLKISDIVYSLFDQYENSYGIRIRYTTKNIENKEKEILNIFKKYEIVLR
jgi:hypothetical protein